MLEVTPIPLEAEAPATTSIIELTNRAPSPAALQIRIYRWTQNQGEDELNPTKDVVLSPPITTIAAGATQVVRVVRVTAAPLQEEEAYRVMVDELPVSGAKERPVAHSVHIQMQYLLPVFYTPSKNITAPPKLSWTLARLTGDKWNLVVKNSGGRRERVSALNLQQKNSKTRIQPFQKDTLVGYVLAGQTRHWPVTLPKNFPSTPGATAELTYQSDSGPTSAELMLIAGP